MVCGDFAQTLTNIDADNAVKENYWNALISSKYNLYGGV